MITVISRARLSYAEVILHDGDDACRVGGEPYMDNSRTSKVCKEHRAEYQRRQKKQRGRQNQKLNALKPPETSPMSDFRHF